MKIPSLLFSFLTWSGNAVGITIERTDPGEPLLLENNRICPNNDERRIFMNIGTKREIVVAIKRKPITKLTLEEILRKVIQSISNSGQRKQFKNLCYQYEDIFSNSEIDLGRTVIF